MRRKVSEVSAFTVAVVIRNRAVWVVMVAVAVLEAAQEAMVVAVARASLILSFMQIWECEYVSDRNLE